jgi:DCC1-like thiol-disulfide oxidoreductase
MSAAIVETGSMATTTPIASAVPWVFAFSMLAEKSIVVDPKSPGSINSPHGLILFDGVCVLCSRGCDFVSKRDRRGYFRFVPMQLAEGRPLAGQLGINPDRPDSFAFVANGQASVKSEAVLRIARELPGWQWT